MLENTAAETVPDGQPLHHTEACLLSRGREEVFEKNMRVLDDLRKMNTIPVDLVDSFD